MKHSNEPESGRNANNREIRSLNGAGRDFRETSSQRSNKSRKKRSDEGNEYPIQK